VRGVNRYILNVGIQPIAIGASRRRGNEDHFSTAANSRRYGERKVITFHRRRVEINRYSGII